MSTRATVFKNNRSQAVRLPKDFAFPDGVRQVEIRKVGSSVMLTPIVESWDEFFASPDRLDDDFEVPQLPHQEREEL